jgi:hypothetical protein
MPRPDLLLHIGMTKTGSTAVQRVLAKHRARLAELGVCYPASPGAGGNHVMLPAFACEPPKHARFNPNDWGGILPEAAIARFQRAFAAEMSVLPSATRLVLLSAEQCSALLTTREEIARLHALLAPHGARIRVLVYLRRQDAHYASAWLEGLRAGASQPRRLPAGGPEVHPRYDYAGLLDRWASVFGSNAVVPRIYEAGSLVGGDVVADLLAAADIPLELREDDQDRRANASLDPSGIALLERMQPRLGALAGTLRVRFVEALGRALPGPGWKPPASEAAAFLARFDEVNEEVRRRWFPDRPRLFLEEPRDDAGASDPDPLGAAMALLTLMLQEGASREAALHARIAGLHRRASQPEDAARAWRAVLRSDPTHPAAHHALAEAALAEGDHRTAEAHLGRIEAAHPGHALAGRLRQKLRPAPPAPKPG